MFTSFLNFSAWEHFSLLWQTWARFCSDWTNPIKPLSVMLTHQLSRSECRLTSEPVMADNPMSVTWRQELRSSSWRLNRTLEICDTSSSDKELQPFSTRVFKGMLWFFPCKTTRQDRKNKTETLTFAIHVLARCYKLKQNGGPHLLPTLVKEVLPGIYLYQKLPFVYAVVFFFFSFSNFCFQQLVYVVCFLWVSMSFTVYF